MVLRPFDWSQGLMGRLRSLAEASEGCSWLVWLEKTDQDAGQRESEGGMMLGLVLLSVPRSG